MLTCSALDYDQAGAQLFEFKRWKDRFIITNVGTKLAMDMSGTSGVDGSPVLAHKYNGSPHQQWHIRRQGDEKRFSLLPRDSKRDHGALTCIQCLPCDRKRPQ